ncbi:MAG: type I pullulanase [Tissierellia bacterium]|nr:type I pullulanase [Tissierellia bacterium]
MKIYNIPEDEKLGMIYSKSSTVFKVWAPARNKISLLIYEEYNSVRRRKYQMIKDEKGIFKATVDGDLDGHFYTYLIEDKYEVTDPYSVACSINSEKSAIVDLASTDPLGFRNHKAPDNNYKDAIIYEVHVKDYSIDISSGTLNRGKYTGLVDRNSNYKDYSTGLKHLKDLGVTHVHLMPIADFITVREENEKFFSIDNYNWGYDPELYNVPEGTYATEPRDPKNRIKELKELIMALHQEGISVVLDVVYNHTYRSADSNFNTIMPMYYYRSFNGGFSNGSGCGNEFASERNLARKFIIDSLKYWQSEYRVDGFRFDLMALIDRKTIYKAVEELRKADPNTLIYGEPWAAQSSPLPLEEMTGFGSQKNKNYALFNPFYRDALKGEGDNPNRGFLQGDHNYKNAVETGILGSIDYDETHKGFCSEPDETINYYNSHDNLIITDKLKLWFGDIVEIPEIAALATSIIMTSQGIPFIHAGNEFLRDKKLVRNSYKSDLTVNGINWSLKEKYFDLFNYTKDIIEIRKEMNCFSLSAEEIRKNIRLIPDLPDRIIAYEINSDFKYLIVHNSGWDDYILDLSKIKSNSKKIDREFEYSIIFDKSGKTNMRQSTKLLNTKRISTTIIRY